MAMYTRRSLLALALTLAAAPAWAQDAGHVIRIAATGYVDGGKLQVGSAGAAGRVAREGWLAARLKEKGYALDWMVVAGDTGPVINEAFASHRIQFASYGDLPSLILNAAGVQTRMIVPVGRGQDVFLLVPNGSPARTLRDLKGKRISLHRSRPWELSFYKLLKDNGLKKSDFRILNMDPHAGVGALAGGQVDAMFSNNGLTYQARKAGRVIWSSQNDFDKKMRAELWAAQPFIAAHPDIAQLAATAFVRAEYYNAQDANREEVLKEAGRNGTPPQVVRQTYSNRKIAWKDYWTPLYDGFTWKQYRSSAAFAFDNRMIGRKIAAETLLEPRFVQAALKDLKLEGYWQPARP